MAEYTIVISDLPHGQAKIHTTEPESEKGKEEDATMARQVTVAMLRFAHEYFYTANRAKPEQEGMTMQ